MDRIPTTSGSADRDEAVAAPAITTPRGGGAIRGIGEKLSVNPATGAAALTVPLPLSTGRGFEPDLALTYGSLGGNGPFALGWSLSVSSVSRKTEKGLPRYRDAEGSDTFVLSGADDLVPALRATAEGWERDVQERDGFVVERFRPRVEEGFTRIERLRDRVTGEVHWRATSKENVVNIYGRSAACRIADPTSPERVFTWLLEESHDDRGNLVAYEYKQEDLVGIDRSLPYERHRRAAPPPANRYLKRVRYGNSTPFDRASFRLQLVFDFGDHNDAAPEPAESRSWPVRRDPFSTFRAGFELRTYRLCRRVLLFHDFPELGSSSPTLVKSLDVSYNEDPVASFVSALTYRGYVRNDAGGYDSESMPPLELAYSEAVVDATIRELDADSLENLPIGLDGSAYRWIDLWGEGVAGVLTEQAHAWFYKRNEGGGRLGALQTLPRVPSPAALGTSRQQLLDLAGEGEMYLVDFDRPLSGYWRLTEDEWQPFEPFSANPNVGWADPNLRLIDLTGDGVADLLVSEDDVFVWQASLGRAGFASAERVQLVGTEEDAPRLVFADATQSIHLADMSGDGLVDLVRVRNGEICYWPNLGYGRFGAKVTMGGAPKPDFPDEFDERRIRFVDIDGSGTNDLIYLGRDSVTFWFNQSGNSWSTPHELPGVAVNDATAAISVVDLFGSGTACLVWSSQLPAEAGRQVRYIDLMSAGKPHLLTRLVSNLGSETRLEYESSTAAYLRDRADGRPWLTKLHFPVHVVTRWETRDEIAHAKLVATYRHHEGNYDRAEREFRGFGYVEQWDTESFADFRGAGLFDDPLPALDGELQLPPIYTRSWFHTGVFLGRKRIARHFAHEYYAGDPNAAALPDALLPGGIDADGQREACRALRGRLLRQESYALDGTAKSAHPYLTTESTFEVRLLQPARDDTHTVVYPCHRETLEYHYEREPADPRAIHSLTLDVDDFGNVTRSISVSCARRSPAYPEQATPIISLTETDFVNRPTESEWYRLGVPVETRISELAGLPPTAGDVWTWSSVRAAADSAIEIPYEATPSGAAPQMRTHERIRKVYYRNDLSGPLRHGQIESLALPYEAYREVLTPGLIASVYGGRVTEAMLTEGGYVEIDGTWWSPSGREIFDASLFYLAGRVVDPFGNETSVDHDAHGLLVTATTDPAGNTIRADNDYRVLAPSVVTDPNGNRTAVRFDALGRVVASAVEGKPGQEGDTLDAPTIRLQYEVFNWMQHGKPNFVRTISREQHGVANQRWQEGFTYSDGSGREAMKKIQAEPGLAPARGPDGVLLRDDQGRPDLRDTSPNVRWVGTGRTIYDNKAHPVKQYEPFFSSTQDFEDEADLVEWGVTVIMRYDPLGRVIRTDNPDGTLTKVELDPWEEQRWNEDDTVLESRWYSDRQALSPLDPNRRAAQLSAAHARTPTVKHVDPAGRIFLAIEDNGGGQRYETRTHHDVEGNIRAVTDARGLVALEQAFDMHGHKLHVRSADAGGSWALLDVRKAVIRTWDDRDYALRRSYDELRRLTHVYVSKDGGTEALAEQTVYGETHPSAATLNLRGRIFLHYDPAGGEAHEGYDFKGNLLRSTLRLAKEYRQETDWTPLAAPTSPAAVEAAAEPMLEAEPFTTVTTYDALNRPTSIVGPDNSQALPEYNEASLLERLRVRVRGGAETTFVQNVDYNAKRQRERILYASGKETRYDYDPLTFRLTRLTTTRGNTTLQDFQYTFDAIGNVVEMDDGAQQTVFFANAEVAPTRRFEYDALTRLTRADGREHAGQTAQVSANDAVGQPLPHPADAQALRAYTEQYVYDGVGNILSLAHASSGSTWTRRYAYASDSNRLTATSLPGDPTAGPYSAAYDYDEQGNMTRLPNLPSVGWDFKGHLRSVDLGGGGTAYYVYDALGRRIRKVIERVGSLTEDRISLDGFERYRRRNASILIERDSLHVRDDTRRIALVETTTIDGGAPVANPTPNVRYQLADHLGSAVLETDDTGAVISYEEFHPFGSTSYSAGRGAAETSLKRYRYSGKERDEETGLYYYGARYYAAWLGRWTSTDPTGMTDGTNLYVYARNSPLRYTDPGGSQAAPPAESANDTPWYKRGALAMWGATKAVGNIFVEAGKQVYDLGGLSASAFGTATGWYEYDHRVASGIGKMAESGMGTGSIFKAMGKNIIETPSRTWQAAERGDWESFGSEAMNLYMVGRSAYGVGRGVAGVALNEGVGQLGRFGATGARLQEGIRTWQVARLAGQAEDVVGVPRPPRVVYDPSLPLDEFGSLSPTAPGGAILRIGEGAFRLRWSSMFPARGALGGTPASIFRLRVGAALRGNLALRTMTHEMYHWSQYLNNPNVLGTYANPVYTLRPFEFTQPNQPPGLTGAWNFELKAPAGLFPTGVGTSSVTNNMAQPQPVTTPSSSAAPRHSQQPDVTIYR